MTTDDFNLIDDFMGVERKGVRNLTLDLAFSLIHKIERMGNEGFIGKASGKGCFGTFTMFGTDRARLDGYWNETRYIAFEASNWTTSIAIIDVACQYIKWYNEMQDALKNESERWKRTHLKQ